MSAPEFSLQADEFGDILTNTRTVEIITTRVDDLKSNLYKRKQGVELITCPVHGEHMVLRKKSGATGLLDAYFLACPHWEPNDRGCRLRTPGSSLKWCCFIEPYRAKSCWGSFRQRKSCRLQGSF